MKRIMIQRIRHVAWCAMLVLVMGVSAYAEEVEMVQEEAPAEAMAEEDAKVLTVEAEAFDCHIVDEHGQNINGYYSEEEDVWYLFVPSTEDIAALTLYVQGEITEVSAGELDQSAGTVTGAFVDSNEVMLTCNGEAVYVEAMQSDLPSLHIVLADATLDEVHEDKDTKYKNNSVYLSDPSGEYDLTVEGSVEMKGRGNSTWMFFDKKGYQIKFDSKTSVMGMGKAKKWVLLANASDDSMMRTQLTYQMASQMEMAFVPSFEYIDLWINGEYRGTYIIGEKIELGGSRLDLADTKGALFEHDEAFYREEDYWFLSTMLQRHFVLKESVEEDDEAVILEAMDEFVAAVDELTEYLYSTPTMEITLADLASMIDVDSFIKYYLVNEYTLNRESFATSFYWYKDGPEDVIHLGPIWDFDTCMGNDGADYDENYGDEHILFRYLLAIPEFYQRTLELWDNYMSLFAQMSDNAMALYSEIRDSAEMNYLRWDVLGKSNPKGGEDFHDTFTDAVDAVQLWLEEREEAFSVPACKAVTSVVSDDCYELAICFQDGEEYERVRFAVWSLSGGQNDLAWYNAVKDENGSWRYTADLGMHNSAGIYRIDVYPNQATAAIATGRNYVETARKPSVWIDAEVAADCVTMELTLQDTRVPHTQVNFAVWSAVNGQDDIRWYPAVNSGEGQWSCTVELGYHNSAGTYHIHAYSDSESGRSLAAMVNASVAKAVTRPLISTELTADYRRMEVVLENAEDVAEKVWFAVWSMENDQDDLRWYEASRDGDTWSYSVDVTSHGSVGNYLIHAYGGKKQPTDLLADNITYVPEPLAPAPTLLVKKDGGTLTLTLENAEEYKKVWFPMWSEENGQDDLFWHEPRKQSNGNWVCTVNLSESGTYAIHVYGGDSVPEELLTHKKVTVEVAGEATGPQITATLTEDGKGLELLLENTENAKQIWIPVWSDESGQDDIVWYQPTKKADGTWIYTVDLSAHNSVGVYQIHAYQGDQQPSELIAYTNVTVETLSQPSTYVTATVSDDSKSLTLVLESTEIYERIWMPVWSEENGQDDLKWYEPVKRGSKWTVTVDLKEHSLDGRYFVHVYSGFEIPVDLIAHTTAAVG